ncbi:NRAG7 protein [Elysia marginata]|uniref:NRAG7 protein n=1 Tax=Elysia marginata TaxID=1093978 RepID=A0AAV4EY60_9GAST|nr:NRAG7 protein [Elysia marginata]
MDHSHGSKLCELCRLCGQRVLSVKEKRRNRPLLLCSDYTADILLIFDIFVERDRLGTHPPYMCYKCHRKMIHYKKAGTSGALTSAREQAGMMDKMWIECDTNVRENDCLVCKQYFLTSLGNRFTKRTDDKEITTPKPYNIQTDNATATSNNSEVSSSDTATTSTSTQQIEFVDNTEDSCEMTSLDFTDVQTVHHSTPKRTNCTATQSTSTQVTPQRKKPTLVECASSPIFKEDSLPKPLPDIQTPLTDT